MFYLSSVTEKNIQIFNQKTSVKVQHVLSEFSDREEYPNIQSEDICQGATCFI